MKPIGKRCALIGIAALATIVTLNPAGATPKTEPPESVVVQYADLDLSRPEDARRLYDRIVRAARKICFNDPSSNLERLLAYEECKEQAVTAAVEKVQAERVSAILRTRNPRYSR